MLKKMKTKLKYRMTSLKQRFLGTHRPASDPGSPKVPQLAVVRYGHENVSDSPTSHDGVPFTQSHPNIGQVETTLHPSEWSKTVSVSQVKATENGIESASYAWAGLKMLQDALDESAVLFGPLKCVIDGIAMCIGTLEKESQAQEDYRAVKADLDRMFEEIRKLLVAAKTPVMRNVIAEATSDLNTEIGVIVQKREQSDISRLLGAAEYAADIEGFYRKTQKIFNLLIIRVNTGMMEEVNKQIMDQKLKSLPNSLAARYRSAQSTTLRRGPCTPNTRVEVLHKLMSWAKQPDGHQIYWLNGMAGTGKTTIAYSLCQELQGTGKLAASFFCSRQVPECRDANKILPTIACQLASRSPAYRNALSDVLEKVPDAYDTPLEDQFDQLITTPLEAAENEYPTGQVVVIDALDECDDRDLVDRLLVVLLARRQILPVRFFVTGRSEAKIRDRIEDKQNDGLRNMMHLHELERISVQNDIRTYLTARLEPANLSPDQIDILAERSGALFIYAATVVRYVSYDNFSKCTFRLNQVLGINQATGYTPEHDIDLLYASILRAAMEDPDAEDTEETLMVDALQTVIFAYEPLSLDSVGRLLGGKDAKSIASALRPLYSVLNVAQVTGIVTTLHESFPSYIRDPHRSGRSYCDPKVRHESITQQCLNVIAEVNPPLNVCRLESSYMLDEEVQDLEDKVKRHISDALSYACRYWAEHLMASVQSRGLADRVEKLMRERLLLWMEVMNLKKYHSDVGTILSKVIGWSRDVECHLDVKELMQDAWRFATVFYMGAVRKSTPHIYISGLTYWPRNRPVSRQYKHRMPSGIVMSGSGLYRQLWATLGEVKTDREVLCMALSPDGTQIVSGSDDHTLCIWDAHTGQQKGQPLQGHTKLVQSVAYSPDGARVVSGSYDRTLRIWDTRTGQQVGQPFKGHTGAVLCVTYSPDGSYVASGSYDRTLRIWDALTGQQVGEPLEGHTDSIRSVAYSPDGAHIVSGSEDRTLRMWNGCTGQLVGQPLTGHAGSVYSVAYSPDGVHIVSCSSDSTLRKWDAHTRRQVGWPWMAHTGSVSAAAYSPEGSHVVSGSSDGTLCIWNAYTGQQIGQPLQGHTKSVSSVAYLPDGLHVVSGSSDHTLRIWDAHTGQQMGQPLQGHASSVQSVAYSPDGACVVSGSSDCTLCIWDVRTGQQVGHQLQGHTRSVNSVAYSPDGAYIVSGSGDCTLRIWDAHTGQPVGHPLQGHVRAVLSVAYSPDGSHVVSGSYDCTLRIWHALAWRQITQPLQGHTGSVMSVAYSPDGTHVVSGSLDGTLRIWDACTGQPVGQSLAGHDRSVWSVAYSPDGIHVVSGSFDHTLRIWNARTGQQVGHPLRGHTDSVRSVAYSSNGAHIVSGSWDHTIRFWDAHTGQQVGHPLEGHTDTVRSLAYSPDGAHVVSGSADYSIHIWQPFGELVPSSAIPHDPSSLSQSRSTGHSHQLCSSWITHSDGWITASTGEHLLWVPTALHKSLLPPQKILLISQNTLLALGFRHAYLGMEWTKCYRLAD